MSNGPRRSVVIGTSGHIDHGKTALVKALTGTDTDRLPEEKSRGITIDLGFASLDLDLPGRPPLRISFVDVPGHQAFIHNMLAGAGGIDGVLLVISAQESIKPQTIEHLAICKLLGVSRGLTAITKADTVGSQQLARVLADVRHWQRDSFLRDSPVIAVSAFTGAGMPELKAALAATAESVPLRSSIAVPRLPVDRAFPVKGFGAVVTGTLQAGVIERGAAMVLEPGERAVRVRGIQSHGHEEQRAIAGSRVALNFAGIRMEDIQRGDMAIPANTLQPSAVFDVEVTLLPDSPALKHRGQVRFHAFASDSLAFVTIYGANAIEPGSSGLARLRLTKPIVLLPGDRFVLRWLSPSATIGGGRILDAHSPPKEKKTARQKWLEKVSQAGGKEQLRLRALRRGAQGIAVRDLVRETGLRPAPLREALNDLAESGQLLFATPDLAVTRESALQALKDVLHQLRQSSPARRAELRRRANLSEPVFDFALQLLAREKKVFVNGESVQLPGATGLSPEDERRLTEIESRYAAVGLAAPLFAEVREQLRLDEAEMRRLMTLLLRKGSLVKLSGNDLYIHRDALRQLREQVQKLRGESLDVARFKSLTGLSRKYAIPLLEHLDQSHITRREGDRRIVI
jgi:selenocysteine-specific elongation factor